MTLTRVGTVSRSRKTTFGERDDGSSGGNVQNGSVLGVALSILEQRQKRDGEVELTLDVEVKHLVPTLLLGKVDHRSTPGETRVVDQDVEPGFGLLDLVCEGVTASFASDVGLKSDAETLLALGIAGSQLAQLLSHLLEIGELSAGNVDLGAVANVGGSDHLADTGTASGNEGDLAIEREETVGAELGHDFGGCVLGHCDVVALVCGSGCTKLKGGMGWSREKEKQVSPTVLPSWKIGKLEKR